MRLVEKEATATTPSTMAKVPNNTNIKKLPPVVKYYTIPSMGYAADTESREKLGHRLNRVIGQLQSLQKRVVAGGSDCVGDIQQIKAANNALWKVAEAYLEIHLSECMRQKKPAAEIEKNLQSVIRATFTM